MKSFFKFITALAALGFLGGLFVLGIIISISFDLPQINSLADYNPAIPSRIYSKDGELLLELAKERREIAQFEEIPQRVVGAFLAAEDDNFFNHAGVDYIGIARAMIKNIKAGRIVQGASTITQQVAKSLLLSSERTFTRKIKDLLLAKRIEDKFTKEEILFLYLNQVYLGGGYYGIKAAFQGYFDKELSEATAAEAALVAGLLVAPGKYSPYRNPNHAKTRQKYVLGRMKDTGKISEIEYQEALKEEIRMKTREGHPMKAGYFTDWIRQRLIKKFGEEDFYSNGYEVVTTLDWSLQKKAEEEIWEGVKAIDKRQGFKGPLERWEDQEKIVEKLTEQRKAIYEAVSLYFTFYPDGSTVPEFEYSEGELEKILEYEKEEFATYKSKWKHYLEIGIQPEDEFSKFIEIDKNYKAVVTKVSNNQRMIYVSVAGVKGMIPYERFRWAHERNITEDRNYWSYVTRPESVLSPGDVVLVRVAGKPRELWPYLHSDFRRGVKDKDSVKMFKNQKFFLMDLDQEPDAQAALVAISPQSGEIISMVGGSDFSKSQFNRAVQSNRQPGSAFKPVIYAAGLENGFTPATMLLDSPQALGGADDSLSWKPRNYDGKFKGEMTFRKALETSRNMPTIRLTQDVGVSRIRNLVERLNVDADLPKDLSVSLGSFGMNLLDLVKAYSIFPNGGRKVKLKSIISIKDRFGKVHHLEDANQDPGLEDEKIEIAANDSSLKKPADEQEKAPDSIEEEGEVKTEENPFLQSLNEDQVYDARLAYLMTNLLKGVIQNGTGRGAKNISSFIGGKTGTTNNYVDAWFLGFSSKIVTGVWTGFDNNDTLGWGETGAKSALPIWKDFMELGLKKYGEYDFPTPGGIVNVAIDPKTGKLAKSNTSSSFMEAFVEGTEPGSFQEEVENNTQDLTDSFMEDEEYYISQ
ncbi:MAG: PBP1A family penicillin-binding protein [Bacteriovoracaceae bacterium]